MTGVRLTLAATAALLVAFGLFWLMQWLLDVTQPPTSTPTVAAGLERVRIVAPPPPPPPPPPTAARSAPRPATPARPETPVAIQIGSASWR